MSGVLTAHSNTHLFPEQDAYMERLINDDLFFAPFIKDLKVKLVTNDDGSANFTPAKIPNSIVVRMDHLLGGNKSTYGEMPLRKKLTGKLARGDQDYENTGEVTQYMWRRLYCNAAAKTVQCRKGLMSDLRDAAIFKQDMKKIDEMYDENREDLKEFFVPRMDGDFIASIYDGSDEGVTTGLDFAPNGIGMKRVFHPNMYVNTVNATTGGTLTAVGTEFYSKTPAQCTTALHTNFSDIKPISDKFVTAMAIKCSKLKIQKGVHYKGRWYWVAVITREVLAGMSWNDKIIAAINNANTGQGEKGILFGDLHFIYGEFLWVVSEKVPRSWDNTQLNFEGTDGYHEAPTIATGKTQSPVVVLGAKAIGWLNPIKFGIRMREANFNYNTELLALSVYGMGRGEYVDDDYLSSLYSTGNSTSSTLETAIPITNQYSALFFVNNSMTVS